MFRTVFPSETCRLSFQNKINLIHLVHLVGFTIDISFQGLCLMVCANLITSNTEPTNQPTNHMQQSTSSEANRSSAIQETPRMFIQPESPLMHSKASATCPSPEPQQSSQCPPISLEDSFHYYPPIYA